MTNVLLCDVLNMSQVFVNTWVDRIVIKLVYHFEEVRWWLSKHTILWWLLYRFYLEYLYWNLNYLVGGVRTHELVED